MAGEEGSWRTAAFRQSVVSKIDEAIQRSGMPTAKNSVEMENHVFQKAKTKEEYLSFVARLILHVRELNAKKGQGMSGPAGGAGQTMQDPINALQTLARQGTGNAQMIGLGPQAAGMVPQPTQIPASNLLQTLNQRPGQPLGGLTSLQNKVPDLGLGPGAQELPAQKRKRESDDIQMELMQLAEEHYKKPETECDIIAKSWAVKLEKMDSDQRRLAEKFINDIIFEGESGNLKCNSVVINVDPTRTPASTCTEIPKVFVRGEHSCSASSSASSTVDSPQIVEEFVDGTSQSEIVSIDDSET